MSTARFRVYAALDSAGSPQKGTVEIDRETGMFYVRPHKRRKRYEMPLSVVATMVCRAEILDEMRRKKEAKGKKRK